MLVVPALTQITKRAWNEGIQDFPIGFKSKKSYSLAGANNPVKMIGVNFKENINNEF